MAKSFMAAVLWSAAISVSAFIVVSGGAGRAQPSATRWRSDAATPGIEAPPVGPTQPDQAVGLRDSISGLSLDMEKRTAMNKPVAILLYYNLDSYCRPNMAKISGRAQHGRVEFVDATFTDQRMKAILFSNGGGHIGSLSRCIHPSFISREAIYYPDSYYVGRDAVALKIYDMGVVRYLNYTVVVTRNNY